MLNTIIMNYINSKRKFQKSLSLLFFLTITFGISMAQTDCPCCTDFHKQFDFWVGEWVVYDTVGMKLGENSIVKLEDNCILNEHWRGAKGSTGSSYNYFDLADSTWNQVWIDKQGGNLVLKGKAEGNKMILQSKLIKGQKVDWDRNRITWSNNDNGSVTQFWEILDKNNNQLAVAFKGIYRRK